MGNTLMNEKKLTDEEIVKDIERSTGMPSYWKSIVLDLIHRLQDENELLKQEKQLAYDTVKGYSLTDIEQKAEIERLTEYCGMFERGEIGSPMTNDKMLALEKEKIELQKQVDGLIEENGIIKSNPAMIVGRSLGKTIREKLLNYDRMKEQNDELQKQVDELKAENTELYKERTTLIAGSILQKQNIVKDTAKEIATWLPTTQTDDKNELSKIIKECYDVEVE